MECGSFRKPARQAPTIPKARSLSARLCRAARTTAHPAPSARTAGNASRQSRLVGQIALRLHRWIISRLLPHHGLHALGNLQVPMLIVDDECNREVGNVHFSPLVDLEVLVVALRVLVARFCLPCSDVGA